MLLPDVNVVVYAIRQDSPDHAAYRAWLSDALTGDEPVGISELALSGVIRLITNHRVFRRPSTPREAVESCRALRSAPAAVPLRPGPRHWDVFASLCTGVGARANVVPDAYHAALAIESGATLVSTDRGFARFPGLRVRHPFS